MAVHLMTHLDRRRFHLEAVSLYDPRGTDLEAILLEQGIRVAYLGKRPGPDPRMVVRLYREFRRFRPHIVHTHRYVLRYALPLLLFRRRTLCVHTVHSLAQREVDLPGIWVHRAAYASGVVPVSIATEVSKSLRHLYGLRDVPLIPNGIPVAAYGRRAGEAQACRHALGFSDTDILVVSVGRLSEAKNPLLLLEAFSRASGSDEVFHLLLVGDGPLRGLIERRREELGLMGRVHLLGVRSDVPTILGASDVFVLASDWEGNPLSVMEAMAAGLPVVATAVGGVPELVDEGMDGFLVPPRDPAALAAALRSLLREPERRKTLGAAARRKAVARFDVSAMARKYEALYESLLAERGIENGGR